jgi:hypothetical protein
MPNIDVDLMALISGAVISIMWFGALEYRVKASEKDRILLWKKLEDMSEKHDALDTKVMDQLMSIRESLARLEGLFMKSSTRK